MSEHHDHHEHPAIEDRVRALESLLIEKGIVTGEAIDRYLAWVENDIGPLHGARVVARAWVDPDFRGRLLRDARAAVAELGLDSTTHLVVVENTPAVHNVVCCTLCSCYPWKLLGLPPTWYKSPAYRSRVVIDPRGVLREFGLEVPESVEVRVWDSTSECRYMVLPQRPAGTERLSEADLAALVTRDSMVGVGRVAAPAGVHPNVAPTPAV
ncbi:MAG: nitrile hydratase subunit alpha [Chloroflexi bacterium]|nr:nitrile hydratase subunit alpha [Chloroflexota bacterium]